MSDVGNEFINSVAADGQTPMSGTLKVAAGTYLVPSVCFNAEQGTGIYRPGTSQLGITIATAPQMIITTGNVNPGSANVTTLGTAANKWAAIYATSLFGNSTAAYYADLAERFSSDQPYSVGTIVELGGIEEVTLSLEDCSENVFGVVSSNPGYLMNAGAGEDDTHPAIAIAGRVPVRVVGTVNKGDRLVGAGNGVARAGDVAECNSQTVIGRALEDKDTTNESLVEAIVKINL